MLVSMFVHVTVEPAEILIGSGVNPPATILAVMGVGVGAVDELPHAVAAVNAITAKLNFIHWNMSYSLRQYYSANELPARKAKNMLNEP